MTEHPLCMQSFTRHWYALYHFLPYVSGSGLRWRVSESTTIWWLLVWYVSIYLNAMIDFETDYLELKLVFIGAIVVTTIYAVKGGCRHIFYLTPSQIIETVKLNFVAQAFGITSPTLGKLSVGFLMQRILGPHTVYRKWFIHIVMAVYGLWTALTVIFTYTQCTPTSALWNPTPDMKCWGNRVFPDIAVSHGGKISITRFLHKISLTVKSIRYIYRLLVCTVTYHVSQAASSHS